MSTQEALFIVALVGFAIGWVSSRWRIRSDVVELRQTLDQARALRRAFRADLRNVRELASEASDLSGARYKAGFAAGVAAYPTLSDEGRRDVLEAWRPSK